jgi:hypothetical protein
VRGAVGAQGRERREVSFGEEGEQFGAGVGRVAGHR